MGSETADDFSGDHVSSQKGMEEGVEGTDPEYISEWPAEDEADTGRTGDFKSVQRISCLVHQRAAYSSMDQRDGGGML